jgi:hypothetical protein
MVKQVLVLEDLQRVAKKLHRSIKPHYDRTTNRL